MKTNDKETATNKAGKGSTSTKKEIKTDMPISEKDEVKDAEKRTQKSSKNHL